MSGIGDMLGGLLGGGGSSSQNSLLNAVIEMIGQKGGLQSVLSQLQSGPMGDAVSSWMGTGSNQQVSSDQIGAAFSDETLQNLSQRSGLSTDEVKNGLAEQLPGLIDRLTPGGSIGSADQLKDLAATIPGLGKLFG